MKSEFELLKIIVKYSVGVLVTKLCHGNVSLEGEMHVQVTFTPIA